MGVNPAARNADIPVFAVEGKPNIVRKFVAIFWNADIRVKDIAAKDVQQRNHVQNVMIHPWLWTMIQWIGKRDTEKKS